MAKKDTDLAEDPLLHLERRLERELFAVRRLNRFWRWSSLLLGAGLIACILDNVGGVGILTSCLRQGMPVAMVTARGYTLINKSEQKTAILDNDKYGAPTLAFIDLNKNFRADMRISNDGAVGFHLYDAKGKRGRFGLDESGLATLELLGAGGKGGITLRVSAEGSPKMQLLDPAGKVLFEVPGLESR